MLIILTGLQGTGKTTVAKMIAERIDGTVLTTDEIRRELFPIRKYTHEESRRVYQEMYERTRKLLTKGQNVILDATFIKQAHREQATQIAKEAGTDCRLVEVVCKELIVRERLADRYGDASEATFKHYLMFKKGYAGCW